MPSVIYNSAMANEARGLIDYDTDTFRMMLVTATYVPDVDLHAFRSDVTNEVVGTGYTAGGSPTACTVTQDNANNRVSIAFAAVTWPASSITARGAVIYKSRGGLATADELVAYIDFGSDKSSSGGDFTVTPTTPIYKTAA